ncbi:hypothetical protein TGS27_0712 [Geobacillus stearothermophilus]|uniref:Uncharacterized protein n=1 Tax=Geobacillus stearothermophilus TaxID=1422 RepID=A0A150MD03_GEOSE|nr:hypothetical protein B4109_1329 [Geobacillus stearothermophilus]OAO85397.1 hypothetical protein TGS27_0712 [Geobacillus stearothermophilus]
MPQWTQSAHLLGSGKSGNRELPRLVVAHAGLSVRSLIIVLMIKSPQ